MTTISPNDRCPLCEETGRLYLFVIRNVKVLRCPGCGLVSLASPSANGAPFTSYPSAFEISNVPTFSEDSLTERDACQTYIREMQQCGLESGRLLLVAPRDHIFAQEALKAGFTIARHVSIAEIEQDVSIGQEYDAAVVLMQIEKAFHPLYALQRIRTALKPNGLLTITCLSLDSWAARFFETQWIGWDSANRFYFNRTTLQLLLLKAGFNRVWTQPDRKLYTFRHIAERAAQSPRTALTRAIGWLSLLGLPALQKLRLRLSTSGIITTSVCAEQRERPLVSIIVPVYNERKTFESLMNALLIKTIRGVDREIIIVESNSKDGTRDAVRNFGSHPEVRLLFEDRPQGKGHAVRAGFATARGDILMIQDADLEYDLNDYDALLEPLLRCQRLFVLGARHGRSWKMRQFNDQQHLATLFNIAHIMFTSLINILYGQHMKDPFTMFKVFRRDCLYGLGFECNHFDFDHELVIKLVRKGYTPLEIPINYRARSYKEGKKVNIFREPLRWIWIDFKNRFVPLSFQKDFAE